MEKDKMGSQSKTKKLNQFLWPSVASLRAILGSLCFHWGMLMVVGLKLETVSVPPSGIVGGSVTLGCDYLLESDTLFSLQWYRDGHEFFRYVPGNRDSPINTFPLPGVHVDLGETLQVQYSRVRFKLKNLDLNSGGTYKCEISADSPSFQTLHIEGNISIIALPESPKAHLSGFPPIVQYGDRINGNCTFADTFPAVELTLYLNNAKINSSDDIQVINYEPIKVGRRLTSVIGVKFRAAPKHFQQGILQIRCNAKLFDKRWETLRNITHQNYQPPFYTAGQNRYSSGSQDGGNGSLFAMRFSTLVISVAFTQYLTDLCL